MKSEIPNNPHGFFAGFNFFFILAQDSKTIRLTTKYSSTYRFTNLIQDENPTLYSDPCILPRFQFSISIDNKNFPSLEIDLPNPKNKSTNKKESVDNWTAQPLPITSKNFELERLIRDSRIGTRYLSLRDIVNPNYSIEQVLEKIQNLNFNSLEKSNLYRLVKILYAGNAQEEKTILSNIFREDIDFGNFLQKRIFSIEILPLIYGPFLNEILSKLDERLIKVSINHLSPQVLICLEKSLSKNKWKQIINGDSLDKPSEESLEQIIERNIFKKFSRKIYYTIGSYNIYKIANPTTDSEFREIYSSKKTTNLVFYSSHNGISFFSHTNNEIFLITNEWIETLRIDLIFSSREIKTYEYFLLSPDSLLKIPFFFSSFVCNWFGYFKK